MWVRTLTLRWHVLLYIADHDLLEIAEFFFRDGLQIRQQRFADQGDTGAAVLEDVFVILRLRLRVDGDGDGADFDRAEQGVEELGRVEEQEKDALFGADAESEKGIAGAVGIFQKLLIGDPFVAALDGDLRAAAFLDVAIHKVSGDIEIIRQRDQEIGCLRLVRARNWEIRLRKRAGV